MKRGLPRARLSSLRSSSLCTHKNSTRWLTLSLSLLSFALYSSRLSLSLVARETTTTTFVSPWCFPSPRRWCWWARARPPLWWLSRAELSHARSAALRWKAWRTASAVSASGQFTFPRVIYIPLILTYWHGDKKFCKNVIKVPRRTSAPNHIGFRSLLSIKRVLLGFLYK